MDLFNPGVLKPPFDLAENIINHDGLGGLNASTAALLLKKNLSYLHMRTFDPSDREKMTDRAIRIVAHLDHSVLPIQGPPGTGKTHNAAEIILALFKKNKRIGVSAVGHKVIENLLQKVLDLAAENGQTIEVCHKSKSKEKRPLYEFTNENPKILNALSAGKIIGGTAYLWAHDDMREKLDYLFIDEAAQMSMAYVMAVSRAAKNLILIGDPRQLEQPQQAAHPPGSGISALDHLLDGEQTMPPDRGLFLDLSRRMHPTITDLISGLYYEGRVHSLPGLENQLILGDASISNQALCYLSVSHSGNQSSSHEEVDFISKLVSELLSKEVKWQDQQGTQQLLQKKDILIITPYNAQVSLLSQHLDGFEIGTVDKFQVRSSHRNLLDGQLFGRRLPARHELSIYA
ncbi:MAG: ATP-binding protein [Saprospiraceae bacterium]|nr:ATP-binding protein [Saprospiraceae bacterium]